MSKNGACYWEEGGSSQGVFINYRYLDIAAAAHLDALLCLAYGDQNVFRADRSLRPGDLYNDILTAAAGRAAVMLVIIGQNWTQSLAEGRHNWVFAEIGVADDNDVPLLPVFLTRVHNEHDERKLWTPVERYHEEISTPCDLPPGVPRSLLLDKRVSFGTTRPEADARQIIRTVDAVISG